MAQIYRVNGSVEVKLKGTEGPFPTPSLKTLRAYLQGPTTSTVPLDIITVQYTGNRNVPSVLTRTSSWAEAFKLTFQSDVHCHYFSVDEEFDDNMFETDRAERQVFRETMRRLAAHAWSCLVG